MPRQKKDGKFVNFYMDAKLLERLEEYCKETGIPKTTVIEKAVDFWLEGNDSFRVNRKKSNI